MNGWDPTRMVDERLAGVTKYFLAPQDDLDMRVSDEVLKCVVFLGTGKNEAGKDHFRYGGTGFIVGVKSVVHTNIHYLYLVTAKHVVIGAEKEGELVIRANTKDGKYILFSAKNAPWIYPSDTTVDVAVCQFSPPATLDYKSIPAEMFLSDERIRADNIGVGSEVHISGLFTQHQGQSKNLPIVRTGNVAMMSDEPIKTTGPFGNMEAYLIEGRSIGGLSGSPVFATNLIFNRIPPQYKMHLMGLIYGHWDMNQDASDFSSGQTEEDAAKSGRIHSGIAIVVPAKKILETLNCDALLKNREEWDKKKTEETSPTMDSKNPSPQK
jgi:hypothetical protein